MTHFIINIYCNRNEDWKRHGIQFEGDLKTAKIFATSVARRIKCYDCAIYIYEKEEYLEGEDCRTVIDLCDGVIIRES